MACVIYVIDGAGMQNFVAIGLKVSAFPIGHFSVPIDVTSFWFYGFYIHKLIFTQKTSSRVRNCLLCLLLLYVIFSHLNFRKSANRFLLGLAFLRPKRSLKPVKRFQNRSDVLKFWSLDNSSSKSSLDVLETIYLIF